MNVMIMILPKFCRNIEKKQVNWLKGSSKLHKEGDKWSSRVNRSLSGMERKALRNKQTKTKPACTKHRGVEPSSGMNCDVQWDWTIGSTK